jgi:hypothetical protein
MAKIRLWHVWYMCGKAGSARAREFQVRVFERHMEACVVLDGGFLGCFGNLRGRSVDECAGRSNQTTMASSGRTVVVELPKLWVAHEGA